MEILAMSKPLSQNLCAFHLSAGRWSAVLLGIVLAACPLTSTAEEPADAQQATAQTEAGKSLIGEAGLTNWQDKQGKPAATWLAVGEVKVDAEQPDKLNSTAGEGILLNGKGKAANLYSQEKFGDVSLHIEYFIPKGSNSGVYLQGRYEIQILDSFGTTDLKYSDNGGVYQIGPRSNATGGKAPDVNASLAPGEWQTFEIDFRAPRFDPQGKKTENAKFVRVVHNGQVIHRNVEVAAPTRAAGFRDEQTTGPLMIQGDHGPVAVRNIRVRPLVETR
jgi:hypothetical protein